MDNILYIIMPAYNESETIRSVIKEWYPVIEKHNGAGKSRFVIIDDGSHDDTFKILEEEKEKYPLLIAWRKENGGHGDTVLAGYQYAIFREGGRPDYIFQTDSDGQTRPEEFETFWRERKKYQAIIGYRNHRKDGFSRIFVTKVLRFVIFVFLGQWVTDANTPFRLMTQESLKKLLTLIPEHYNLPNIILSTAYVRFYRENVKFIPITFRKRQGGINSINLKKIFRIGKRAIVDFVQIRRKMDDFAKMQ